MDQEINQYLHLYKSVHELIDVWTVLSIEDIEDNHKNSNSNVCHDNTNTNDGPVIGSNVEDRVYRWRAQAEDAMRSQGKSAMTPAQVQDFVARFMPAYYTYLPWLYQFGPERRRGKNGDDSVPVVKVVVDEQRSASSVWELL